MAMSILIIIRPRLLPESVPFPKKFAVTVFLSVKKKKKIDHLGQNKMWNHVKHLALGPDFSHSFL